MFTRENAVRRSRSPITAYMMVVLAFLIFSSSPYDVVYCSHENTIAPIAKSAPIPMNVFARLVNISLIPILGSIKLSQGVSLAQPFKNSSALKDEVHEHSAKV